MQADTIQLAREALWLVLILSAPPILCAAIAGLVIAFLQAATQVQEQTFPYAVKFVAVILSLMATASLLGGELYKFADKLFTHFPTMVQ